MINSQTRYQCYTKPKRKNKINYRNLHDQCKTNLAYMNILFNYSKYIEFSYVL